MRAPPATHLFALMLLCAACGARSSLGTEDAIGDTEMARDLLPPPPPPDLSACPGLERMPGHYAGTYEGVVNCLEEKHLSSGVLSFTVAIATDGSGTLVVDGTLSEVFFNGELFTARVVGDIDCSGRNEIALSSIRVGAVLTSDVKGWLRQFAFSGNGFHGTWRMERQDPLCLAAGSWRVQR